MSLWLISVSLFLSLSLPCWLNSKRACISYLLPQWCCLISNHKNIRRIQQWAYISHTSARQLMSTGLTRPYGRAGTVRLWVALLHMRLLLSLAPQGRLGIHLKVWLTGQELPWETLLIATVEAQRASPMAPAHFTLLLRYVCWHLITQCKLHGWTQI